MLFKELVSLRLYLVTYILSSSTMNTDKEKKHPESIDLGIVMHCFPYVITNIALQCYNPKQDQ